MPQQRSKPIWPVLALLAVTIGTFQLHAIVGADTIGAWAGLIVLWTTLAWFIWIGFINPTLRRLFGTRQVN